MLSVIRINILYLQTILTKRPGPALQYTMQRSNTFAKNLIFSSAKANTSLKTRNMLDFSILGSLFYIELVSRDQFSIFGIVHEVRQSDE